MEFKDALKKDVDSFMNQTEFAEELTVNGVIVKGIFESVDTSDIDKDTFHGLNKNFFKLHLKSLVYKALKLSVNTQLYVNNAPYFIEFISDNLGIAELRLTQETGRY